MAKQTFTTGQVLTAAQMTSLQETAMGGGPATAKTASYVLVAADAGKTVAMNAAGATTITVNTGLFEAGDTVFIQNLGAGACTVTAGTATVATAGSLVLPQNDAGILYFTATGAAIFYDYIQVGAAGANWSLLNAGGTALTGAATITVSGISAADQIMILISGASTTTTNADLLVRLNTDTGSNYYYYGGFYESKAAYSTTLWEQLNFSNTGFFLGTPSAAADVVSGYLLISGCNSAGVKVVNGLAVSKNSGSRGAHIGGYYNSATVISSISMFTSAGNFDAGTVFVYTTA